MERRLAAIVCADVAGYSRMMGADEAGTHAAFKAKRDLSDHPQPGGRLLKNTGDGFLLEFPSIVGAIESAIAMQALMAEPPPRGSGYAIPHGHPHGRRDRRRRRSIRGCREHRRRWWRNSGMLLNAVLTLNWSERLGLPRLS
jgi:hypothetical protein